jgi:hypothetical protein
MEMKVLRHNHLGVFLMTGRFTFVTAVFLQEAAREKYLDGFLITA